MSTTRGGRVGVAVVMALALAVASAPARAQITQKPPLGCGDLRDDPENTQNFTPLQGTSGLNAQTGNGALVAGLTREGTITVLRWPTPSSYDQIKHFSPDANLPRAGAEPNMGAFLGVVVDGRTTWLRDLPATQRYRPGDSDTVITDYTDAARGFKVGVESVVAHAGDVFAQHVTVDGTGVHRPSALVAFENFSLTTTSVPASPYFDWCGDKINTDHARWDAASAAIVHDRSGYDATRGSVQSVALAIGTGSRATAHQVGGDSHEEGHELAPQDAYDDAADGRLSGSSDFEGNTTGALLAPLTYRDGTAADDVYIAAARDAAGAEKALDGARRAGTGALADAKERWLASRLQAAQMPATPDPVETALARRSLILLATTQAESGAIVASITTQPVYAEDWPRDSAYLVEAMDRGGLFDQARRHGLFLARTQASETHRPPGAEGIPPGAWPMNMFDTGAAGGPIPYEFDEVGFGAWSMWHHYTYTHDRGYLDAVWPAIRRAAELLVSCRDPDNGLQCRNTEDDSVQVGQQQTIGAAMTTYAGLGAAAQAAHVLGHDDDAKRYTGRRAELIKAVDAHLWEESNGYYGGLPQEFIRKLTTYVFWPETPTELPMARMQRHAASVWRLFSPSFDAPKGPRTFGFYDGLALLGLADWDHAHAPGKLADLRRGLHWIAHTLPTPGTGHIGENWRVRDGKVQTITATPQLWEHALFYLASLDVYGVRKPRTCASRRVVRIHAARRIVSATLRDARGRRLRTLRPRGRRVTVSMRGLPAGRVTVRLRLRGRSRAEVRRYRTCAR